jgi:hypothetical protein
MMLKRDVERAYKSMARSQKRRSKPKGSQQLQQSSQPYDNALKALMGDHAAEIIPQLVPDVEVIREQNNEITRENLRADLVYLIRRNGKPHILNMELQTSSDSEIVQRILRYHMELYLASELPVISVVLYLFETSVPQPPFRESEEEDLLTFHYQVIALWTLDAREYVGKRVVSMYALLPGMKGADAPLLLQALDAMKQYYSRPKLGQRLRRFRTILRRSNTVSEQDKQTVEEYMDMHYDSLIDEDPEVQERVARSKAEGELQGKIKALQEVALELVKTKYPPLVELADRQVTRIRQPETLRNVVLLLLNAPDESTARWLLNTMVAQ